MKMGRIVFLIVIFSLVFCACTQKENKGTASDRGSGPAVSGTATESSVSGDAAGKEGEAEDAPYMTVTMPKNRKTLLSKKIDQTKKGIEIVIWNEVATGPAKGDDGNCYYYRKERKKGGAITFYRNNGVRVCETVLPEKYEKKDYFIIAFLKQGGRFWIQITSYDSGQDYLVPVKIKDGKWGKAIKIEGMRTIYYKDRFYSFDEDNGTVDITDQDGKTKKVEFAEEERWATLQVIVDDKFYYTIDEKDSDNHTVMRCDMDGSQKKKLCQYNGVYGTHKISLDGDFLYVFDPPCDSTLTRIPLYGGKVEEIAAADWYELTEDSIFYLKEGKISRINKDLKGKPETVLQTEKDLMEERFHCTDDGHLMVGIYKREERDKLEILWDEIGEEIDGWLAYDLAMHFSNMYYWVSEDGKVEDIIQGSGFDSNYQRLYETFREWGYGENEYEE